MHALRGAARPGALRPTLSDARAALRAHYGYPDFREGQATAIEAVLGGRDVLVLMPTGGGKSLCYQIPAAVLPGPTVVVSPLISLMQDQVEALERVGIDAAFVNSTLSGAEIRRRLEAVGAGDLRLIYVAPERFERPAFVERLAGAGVALLAIDEAHCISQWGHDFRPSYARLGRVRERLGCPTIALTATATPAVRRDIVASLGLRRPVRVVRGFDRPNLEWHVVDGRSERRRDGLVVRLLREGARRRGGAAIVYASTRKAVDALAERLIIEGVPAAAYHAGASAAERERLQQRFMAGEVPVVVATNAFGMGIDKPDVRLVVHHGMPRSLEDYYQEAGRAGRDGRPSRCVLVHRYRDRYIHELFVRRSYPSARSVRRMWRALNAAAGAAGGCDGGGAAGREVGRRARLDGAAGHEPGVRLGAVRLDGRTVRGLARAVGAGEGEAALSVLERWGVVQAERSARAGGVRA
ncbi:MAG: RecQ family ATP-dependent DNA helicase, partial [Gemmatimonadota bacterium]